MQKEYQHKHLSPFEEDNGHLLYTANSVKAVQAFTNSTWCTLLNINKVVFRKKQRLVQTHTRFWSDMSKPPWQPNDEHHQPDKRAKARTRHLGNRFCRIAPPHSRVAVYKPKHIYSKKRGGP